MAKAGSLGRISAIVLALVVVGFASASDAGTTPPHIVTIYDDHNGLQLSLQVEPLAARPGYFRLRIPHYGVYEATAGSAMRVESATSVVVHFSGAALLSPLVTLGGASGTVTTPSTATVELQAQIDSAHHTGEATLRDGQSRYHLVASAADPGGLLPVLRTFERAYASEDWATLYTTMNSDVRDAYTPAAFAALMSDQVAAKGTVVDMRRLSIGDITADDSGATYVAVTYALQVRDPTGTLSARQYAFYFIEQVGGWTFWASKPQS